MSWRDNLQPASFKGALFYVDGSTYTRARRVSVRKLAGGGFRNADMGDDPDEIDVQAYLFGDDYHELRDDLEGVLFEPGPGVLVLPLRGERWVRVVRGPATAEDKDRGGYCTVRFTVVVEDRDLGSLRTRPDTRSSVTRAAAATRASARREFATVYSAKGMPDRYMRPAARTLGAITATLRGMQGTVSRITGGISRATASVDELDNALNAVLTTPSDLVTHLVDAVDSVLAIADTTRANVDRLTGLPNVALGPFERAASARATLRISGTLAELQAPSTAADTELGRRGDQNALAAYRATRAAALARAAETYAVAPFDSSTLALEVLAAVTADIDAVQALAVDDELAGDLADLRASLARHLTETAARLPSVVTYLARDPMPALLVAHELYGDARREADVLARNPGQHPLAMHGELEVLSP